MSVIRRRIAALLLFPALALLIIGCSAVREQTQLWREPPRGTSAEAGELAIRNVVVVADSEGNATLYASFANEGGEPDALTGLIIGDNEVAPDGEIELPTNEVTSISPDHERVDVSQLDVPPGRIVDVEFIFGDAPRTTVQTVVQSVENYEADVTF